MKLFSILLLFSMSMTTMAKENTKTDAIAVDNACSSDAQVAGCGQEKVGTGLLKCLDAYHRMHKEFKLSDGCKTARMQLRKNHEGMKK